jgi:predicted CoA-binding protein
MKATEDHSAAEDESAIIKRLLQSRRIAVVGLSDDPSRPSFGVANYMHAHGYEIIPVNPHCFSVLGVRSAASLADVTGPIDLVNVFRRSELCSAVVKEAIAAGAKGIWLQAGIRSPEARALAKEAGIDYIEDHCLMIEHGNAA